MKKTTTMKKVASIATAALMTACLAVPMATGFTASAANITITGIAEEIPHTFEVYQVLSGELDANGGKLSNVKWGSGITAYDDATVTAGTAVSDEVIAAFTANGVTALDILGNITLGTPSKTETSGSDSITFTGLADGYYVIKDTTNLDGIDDANSAWIVQVAGETKTTSIAIKNETPTVDKQVHDEENDAEAGHKGGWGETADHAINESFQFKLVANVPANDNYAFYETYKLVFKDTYSAGVTYDGIASVKVGDVTLKDNQYSVASDTSARTLDITIDDIKLYDTNLVDGATVEVIYNAHLNENAYVNEYDGEDGTTNQNTVKLQYSNNPDSTGQGTPGGDDKTNLGETPEDSVWVFTYKIKNTKYANSAAAGNELGNAGFKLYASNGTTEIPLVWDDTLSAYRLAKSDETGVEMKSDTTNGTFNISGLDTGTYVLKETTTPDGYNTCADVTIVISAQHVEDTEGVATTNLESTTAPSTNMNNDIVNVAGTTLPGTGGIGTTLFYLIGGTMFVSAGVYLVSKKRMKNREEQ